MAAQRWACIQVLVLVSLGTSSAFRVPFFGVGEDNPNDGGYVMDQVVPPPKIRAEVESDMDKYVLDHEAPPPKKTAEDESYTYESKGSKYVLDHEAPPPPKKTAEDESDIDEYVLDHVVPPKKTADKNGPLDQFHAPGSDDDECTNCFVRPPPTPKWQPQPGYAYGDPQPGGPYGSAPPGYYGSPSYGPTYGTPSCAIYCGNQHQTRSRKDIINQGSGNENIDSVDAHALLVEAIRDLTNALKKYTSSSITNLNNEH